MKPTNTPLTITLLSLLFAVIPLSQAEQDPYESSGWKKLREFDDPPKIEKEKGTQKPIPILTIEEPKINEARHLLAGEVAYTDVAGTAFLEMWTHYGPTEYFFSRTLGEFGPMAKLEGSSEWRAFILPFNGKEDHFPEKLQFNLVLPGGGTVEIRNLRLYQHTAAKSAAGNKGAWWKPGLEGNIGGGSGAFFGVVCSVCTILSMKGKGRNFVLPTMTVCLILACAILIVGLVALATRQPLHVTVPMVLSGCVATFVTGVLLFQMRKIYLKHELQRIAASA